MYGVLKVCGQNIRQYRKKRGLTLVQVSRALGITGAYLGYLERGQRNPSLLTLAKIADSLKVPPYILLRSSEGEFDKELNELENLLIELKEVKHVIFLKDVLESYLKLTR